MSAIEIIQTMIIDMIKFDNMDCCYCCSSCGEFGLSSDIKHRENCIVLKAEKYIKENK